MTFRARGAAYVLTLCAVCVGCGTETIVAPPPAGFRAGTATELEVFALDEVTRTPLVGAEVTFEGASGVLGTEIADASGRATLATSEAPLAVEVRSSGHVTERWTGLGGRSFTLPLERRTARAVVEGSLDGAEGEWTVLATRPARVLHAAPLDTSVSAPCLARPSGCAFSLEAALDGTTSFVAFHSTGGVPDELRVLGTDVGGLALSSATRFDVVEVDVTLPDPGLGATEVVGVPGLAVSGRVAVLPWPMGAGAIALPDTSMELGSAWALFSTTLPDGGTSILVRRDAEADASLAAWSEWLSAPAASVSGNSLALTHPEADLLAVAFYAGETLLRNDLEVRASGSSSVTIPEGATRARVRAIDTNAPADGSLFDLDGAERRVSRLAEREVDLP